MARPFDFITFDCYGTLIDWEGGIVRAFAAAAGAEGKVLDREAVLRAFAEVEPAVEAGPFRPYREVLAEAARRTAERLGWSLSPRRAGFLAESLPGWLPFPDTLRALERLRSAGFRLGILSNVDRDLLQGTLHLLPIPFDLLLTAEDVRSYKPSPGHFLAARPRIGKARWLHAAGSLFHDVAPARALGIPAAWINRKGESAGREEPDRELADLRALADWLGA